MLRILTVSRLCKSDDYKRIDLVIEAVKQLDFCTLNIVGDGDDRARLEALAEGNPRIMFLGQVDEQYKYALYEACDVFVLPSTKEGFGLVFVEAMSHGKPCIGAQTGAAPEVIVHGVTGFLSAPDHLPSLCYWISVFHQSPELLMMGPNAQKRVHKQFSYDRFKARVKELLR